MQRTCKAVYAELKTTLERAKPHACYRCEKRKDFRCSFGINQSKFLINNSIQRILSISVPPGNEVVAKSSSVSVISDTRKAFRTRHGHALYPMDPISNMSWCK